MRHAGANPGRGGHRMALDAGRILYDCRDVLAQLFNIDDPNRIAYMLNATDAINTALLGYLHPGDHVVTTAMEHNALARPLRYLEQSGVELTIVPADTTGQVNIKAIEAACRKQTTLIAVGHASNVTGTIIALEEVGAIAGGRGIRLLVDAAQTAGVEAINVEAMGIDLLAFTGHKGLLGPQGTGGLWVREGIELKPTRWGGTGSNSESDLMPELMPDKLESGTPNTVGIAGLAAGVRFVLETGVEAIGQHEHQLRKQLWDGLENVERVILYGPDSGQRATGVISFNVEGLDSGQVSYILDRQYNIATRAGLHCAPWAHRSIGSFKTGTVRISLGYFNTTDDAEQVLVAIKSIASNSARLAK